MITVQMVGTEGVTASLESLTPGVVRNVQKAVAKLAILLQRDVQENKLSGQVLQLRTGSLRRSIIQTVTSSDSGATGVVRATRIYGRIHEYGGVTPPHVIEPKVAGGVLAFQMGGKTVFARKVNHPGSKIPERSFLRSALKDMVSSGAIDREMQDALATALGDAVGSSIWGA